MATGCSIDRLAEIVADAAVEVARVALCFDQAEILERRRGLPADFEGSCVALVGDERSLQLGVSSDAAGCRLLAGAMLGAEVGGDEMVLDAMCELANVLAGVVKTRIAAEGQRFQIGLPVFVRGHVSTNHQVDTATVKVMLGDVPAHLLVLCSREGV